MVKFVFKEDKSAAVSRMGCRVKKPRGGNVEDAAQGQRAPK